jgi:hypothetical protein
LIILKRILLLDIDDSIYFFFDDVARTPLGKAITTQNHGLIEVLISGHANLESVNEVYEYDVIQVAGCNIL